MIRIAAPLALFSTLFISACSTTSGSGGSAGTYKKDAKWSVSASFTDSCCCNPSCPCLFGSSPSLGHCDGITLLELHRAHYDGVNLDGVKVVAVYRSKRTMSYYVTDKATKAQTEAVVKLIPTFIKFYDLKKVGTVKNVPIKIERNSERVKVTTPDAGFEIVVLKGGNGAPIKLQNMPRAGFPAPPFLDHTQFKSVSVVHRGKGEEFEYEGTNGFVAKLKTVSSSDK